jgi:hypothetical protein
MSALLDKIRGRKAERPGEAVAGSRLVPEGGGGLHEGYDPYDAPGWRDLSITVRGSVESMLPVAEVERIVSDVLADLAESHGVTIDEITVREGDGL